MIDAAARGAWSELDSKLRPFIARRVRSEVDVDDVVQEVFLRMQRGLGGLRDEERFGPWVYRVARSAIGDHQRAAAKHRVVEDGCDRESSVEVDEDDRAGEQALASVVALFVALPRGAHADRARRDDAEAGCRDARHLALRDEVSCAARPRAPLQVPRGLLHHRPRRARAHRRLRAEAGRAPINGLLRVTKCRRQRRDVAPMVNSPAEARARDRFAKHRNRARGSPSREPRTQWSTAGPGSRVACRPGLLTAGYGC